MTMVYEDMKLELSIAHLSNLALLEETERLAANVRRATARDLSRNSSHRWFLSRRTATG